MKNKLSNISGINIFVREYDEALSFYRDVLGFVLIEDISMGEGRRWITLKPTQSCQTQIILSKATSEKKLALVGNQAGESVLMILATLNFDLTYQGYIESGVKFCEEPREEPYGKVVIFEDLYGNKFDLIQPKI